MAYRYDPDLDFLRDVPSSDLDPLVEILIKSGLTEELTKSGSYIRHHPDHRIYWDLIAAEIQCFGANSFATVFRGGQGVLYKEVLTDVCDKLKVNYNESAEVETIERNLTMKVFTDAMEKMSPRELKETCDGLGLRPQRYTAEAVAVAAQVAIRVGGFTAYKVSVIVANGVAKALIGRGLAFAANAALTRSISIFAGPIGWALMGAWMFVDLAGPAYRVTVPAAIMVAYLRLGRLRRETEETQEDTA